ncbi:helix-turn-helix transcriptional regulator [Streptomyces sp. NPDC001793]|uniref:helix-turn-helix domain-containing protein n=1 Tax=Streptomyces sp. NPDC001793 TaxID=3154657 RepID=UPI00331915E8
MAMAVPIGRKIELLRLRRGMSREVLAQLVGRSGEWLRQVERQQRPLQNLPVLLELARVLGIQDLSEFLGAPAAMPPALRRPPCSALRDAVLTRHRTGGGGPSDPPVGRTAETVADAVDRAWHAWHQRSQRYSFGMSVLPGLLAGTAWTARVGWQAGTGAHAYHLASVILHRMHDTTAALLAADRGLSAALASGEPDTIAALRMRYGCALADGGMLDAARAELAALAESLHAGGRGTVWKVSALLAGAQIAAREADWDRSTGLLREARTLCAEVPGDAHGQAVAQEAVLATMAVEHASGRDREALQAAEALDLTAARHRVDWRTRTFLQLSKVYLAVSDIPSAVISLIQMDEACEEEVKYNPTACRLAAELAARADANARAKLWPLLDRSAMPPAPSR